MHNNNKLYKKISISKSLSISNLPIQDKKDNSGFLPRVNFTAPFFPLNFDLTNFHLIVRRLLWFNFQWIAYLVVPFDYT